MTPRCRSSAVRLRDHVVGAANLERAARLHVLALEKQRPPGAAETSMSGVTLATPAIRSTSGVNVGEADQLRDHL